jgi:hypothetical protein
MTGPPGGSSGGADARPTPWPAVALWVLVFLAAAAPWAFGGVQPWAVRALSTTAAATAGLVVAAQCARGQVALPGVPLWPIACFVVLGLLQLVPIPPAVHRVVATGSYAIWHPSNVAAASVLGDVWRPISIHPSATLASLTFIAATIGLAIVAAPAACERRRLERVATVAVAMAALVAVYGVVARAVLGPLIYGTYPVPTITPFGPFVSKNHFAGYVELAALLAIGLAVGLSDHGQRNPLGWTKSRTGSRVMWASGAALALGSAVLLSLSRGGALSLAAGLAVFGAVRLLRRKKATAGRVILFASIALVVGALLVSLPREAHERLTSIGQGVRDTSVNYRLATFAASVRAFASSPMLGFGLGAFADALPRFKRTFGDLRVEHAENDYLEVAVETGVAGVVIAFTSVLLIARTVVRSYPHEESRLKRAIVASAAGALATIAVHALADFQLRIPSNAVLSALMAVLACCIVPPRLAPTPRRAAPIVAGLIAFAPLAIWVAQARPRADGIGEVKRTAGATDAGSQKLRATRAEASLSRAVHSRPAAPELWLALAWTRLVLGRSGVAELALHARELEPASHQVETEAQALIRRAAMPAPPAALAPGTARPSALDSFRHDRLERVELGEHAAGACLEVAQARNPALGNAVEGDGPEPRLHEDGREQRSVVYAAMAVSIEREVDHGRAAVAEMFRSEELGVPLNEPLLVRGDWPVVQGRDALQPRRSQPNVASGAQHAKTFPHHGEPGFERDVLDHVLGIDVVEHVVGKGERTGGIQVPDVGKGDGVGVEPPGKRSLPGAEGQALRTGATMVGFERTPTALAEHGAAYRSSYRGHQRDPSQRSSEPRHRRAFRGGQ